MLVEGLRLIFVIVVVVGANRFASARSPLFGSSEASILFVTALGAAVAYVAGGLIARLIDRGLRSAEDHVARHHASEIVAATLGLAVGVLASALVWGPLVAFVHPDLVVYLLAAFVSVAVVAFSVRVSVRKRLELFGVLGVAPRAEGGSGGCLLDSSAAIDGRVLALVKAGLLPEPLSVPAFIIWELQGIADSEDPIRRRRGRRGLDVLASLREAGAEVRVIDEDPAATTDPDAKLVVVARRRGLPIVTSDGNLARAAELQGIGVFNLHRLAELLRPPVLPGERTHVRLVREGREKGQGVGYLDDGTMVVVENAARLLGKEADVEVMSILQTGTGRMLFAKLLSSEGPQLSQAL